MSNDLERYSGGDLAPYSPGGDLAPVSPHADDWGRTDVDYLDDRFERGFGQLDPQVEANVQALASAFETDFQGLGYVQKDIDLCIGWFRQSLANPPTTMPRKNHGYQLFQFSFDPAMAHFAVFARQHKLSQQMVSAVCYWVQQAEDLMNGVGRFAGVEQQAPASSTEAALDALNDRDFAAVERLNAQVAGQTEAVLRQRWGDAYIQNKAAAEAYLRQLPEADRQFFDQFEPGTWVLSLNTVTTIEGLHKLSLGGALPSGSALQTEIMQIENFMRTNRKAYNKDIQIQNRLRALYERRGY